MMSQQHGAQASRSLGDRLCCTLAFIASVAGGAYVVSLLKWF
ncbi:MAG: hypothetical protein V4724_20470 [Pseudomonadota bacterium]